VSEWRDVTLGDVLTLQRGFDLPSRDRVDGPYPIVSSSGVTGRHAVAKVEPPGVVIGRYGSLGSVHWVTEPYWPLNTALWVKDFKGNDPRFVSYVLRTIRVDESSAAAVPGVNRNHLHRLPVRVPPVGEQRRISAALAAFDELIEINVRRIELLEGVARSLYREWFVRFRVPEPDPLELVESKLGPMPKGWRVEPLESICSFMGAGSTPRRSDPSNWEDGTVDWFTTGELRDGPLMTSAERVVAKPGTRLFEPPMILMAIYGSPTVGRLGWVTRACSCNQAALALRAKNAPEAHEWLWFQLQWLRPHFNAMAQGAAQQNISKEKVAATEVAVPTDEILAQFAERVGPLRLQSHRLRHINAKLASTRNLLLPRLVTGRLDISNVDLGSLLSGDGR
jgi:type I restriction enzyme, S subunit